MQSYFFNVFLIISSNKITLKSTLCEEACFSVSKFDVDENALPLRVKKCLLVFVNFEGNFNTNTVFTKNYLSTCIQQRVT